MVRIALVWLMAIDVGSVHGQESKSPAQTPEEKKLTVEAFRLHREAMQLYQQDKAVEAVAKLRQSLEVFQRLYPQSKYPNGHQDLAGSLANMGAVLQAAGSTEKALLYYEQALTMYRALYPESRYPQGHPNLAATLNNIGAALHFVGSAEKALPFYEQALAMMRRLFPASKYPDGHPHIAGNLSNLGYVIRATGSAKQSLPLFEEALTMYQAIYPPSKYPNGHPLVVRGLNNLGAALDLAGSMEKALSFHERALAMCRTLYPASKYPGGHSGLARSLNMYGDALKAAGSVQKALPLFEEALAMYRTLYPASQYPDGHPDFSASLTNMGAVLQAVASAEQALPYYGEALTMSRKLARRMLWSASEADALNYFAAQPLPRDGFLSVTLRLPDKTAAAYEAVWFTKSAVTRLLEQRQAAARAADAGQAAKLDELKRKRRRIDQLLQDHRLPATERDPLLTQLTDDRDRLERELAAAVPLLQRAQELDTLGPDALVPLLPKHAVLIDFVRYLRIEYDRREPGKAVQRRTAHYAAFLLANGQPVRRVELGAAAPIEAAATAWRHAIQGNPDAASAERMAKHAWAPLAAHLPPDTRVLYLAADGDLARVPWAALCRPWTNAPGEVRHGLHAAWPISVGATEIPAFLRPSRVGTDRGRCGLRPRRLVLAAGRQGRGQRNRRIGRK